MMIDTFPKFQFEFCHARDGFDGTSIEVKFGTRAERIGVARKGVAVEASAVFVRGEPIRKVGSAGRRMLRFCDRRQACSKVGSFSGNYEVIEEVVFRELLHQLCITEHHPPFMQLE